MNEKYSISFNQQFAKEFKNFPQDQKDAIILFIQTFEVKGLEVHLISSGRLV